MNKAEFVHTWIIAILDYFLKSAPIVHIVQINTVYFFSSVIEGSNFHHIYYLWVLTIT